MRATGAGDQTRVTGQLMTLMTLKAKLPAWMNDDRQSPQIRQSRVYKEPQPNSSAESLSSFFFLSAERSLSLIQFFFVRTFFFKCKRFQRAFGVEFFVTR